MGTEGNWTDYRALQTSIRLKSIPMVMLNSSHEHLAPSVRRGDDLSAQVREALDGFIENCICYGLLRSGVMLFDCGVSYTYRALP